MHVGRMEVRGAERALRALRWGVTEFGWREKCKNIYFTGLRAEEEELSGV